MDRQAALAKLRQNRARLASLGVRSASLFGSMARGEANEASDVDVAVELSGDFSAGGFDYFARLEALRAELAAILGSEVDVVAEPVRNPELRTALERDRVVAFQ